MSCFLVENPFKAVIRQSFFRLVEKPVPDIKDGDVIRSTFDQDSIQFFQQNLAHYTINHETLPEHHRQGRYKEHAASYNVTWMAYNITNSNVMYYRGAPSCPRDRSKEIIAVQSFSARTGYFKFFDYEKLDQITRFVGQVEALRYYIAVCFYRLVDSMNRAYQ